MTPHLRIAFVCNEYPPALHGGIGVFTRLMAQGLAAAGHEVRVIGLYPRDQASSTYVIDGNVHVWRIPEAPVRGGWFGARARLFREVAAWVRDGQVDLVEVPDWQGPAAGWPRLAAPVLVRLHGSDVYFAAETGRRTRLLTRWLERASMRRADFWCSSSNYTAGRTRALFGLKNAPDAILHNPVDMSECRTGGNFEDRSDVVFSGTLTPKKGIVPLVDAWTTVRQRCATARLHVFGKDGRVGNHVSMRAYLIARLPPHVRDSVIFHGHVPRTVLLSHLQKARVAVFPSYAEVCAIAPLEAMACGCATISTTRGSGRELFEDGVHGLLVDPDHPENIAAAIVRLLEDDELARSLAAAGREHVRTQLAIDAVVEENVSFYRRCTERFRLGEGVLPDRWRTEVMTTPSSVSAVPSDGAVETADRRQRA